MLCNTFFGGWTQQNMPFNCKVLETVALAKSRVRAYQRHLVKPHLVCRYLLNEEKKIAFEEIVSVSLATVNVTTGGLDCCDGWPLSS